MLLGIPFFCKKKPHICFYSFIRKVATARADVDIFNKTLAVCFLASGPWPVNPRKSNEMQKKKERNGIDLKLTSHLSQMILIMIL